MFILMEQEKKVRISTSDIKQWFIIIFYDRMREYAIFEGLGGRKLEQWKKKFHD